MPVEAVPLPPLVMDGVEFKFDLVPGWSARRTADSTEITRPCLIRGLPVDDGASDPQVLLKATDHPASPADGEVFPTDKPLWAGCTLQDIVITSRPSKTSALANFVYRRKTDHGDGSTAGAWSVTYGSSVSHVTTYATANGTDLIRVWYKPGAAGTVITDGTPATGAKGKSVAVHQMRVSGYLKATALLKGADWSPLKAALRTRRGYINSDEWGTDPRGKWFFVGPTTRTTDFGASFTVELEFLEAEDSWFPMAIWHARDGSHPADSDQESVLTAGTHPSEGQQFAANGITWASIYKEFPYNDFFVFTP
jgi:hypothetical protein